MCVCVWSRGDDDEGKMCLSERDRCNLDGGKSRTKGKQWGVRMGFIYSKMCVQQSMVLSKDLTCKVQHVSCVTWVGSYQGDEHLCRWPAKGRRTVCHRNQGLRCDERARWGTKGWRLTRCDAWTSSILASSNFNAEKGTAERSWP